MLRVLNLAAGVQSTTPLFTSICGEISQLDHAKGGLSRHSLIGSALRFEHFDPTPYRVSL